VTTHPPVLFLPGAGGAAAFWHPVAQRLPEAWPQQRLSWPGCGDEPAESTVGSHDDLVDRVVGLMDGPVDLVAQSMGGAIALRVALRHPDRVRRLVLCATSGGVDMRGHGATDWRAQYRRDFPRAAPWITAEQAVTPDDDVRRIAAPTLLLWSDRDDVSPLSVGRHLSALLPDAALRTVADGTHSFAQEQPDVVAPLVTAHLR
jgi:pimeloyl-ACP methyl ester carboxylesterase